MRCVFAWVRIGGGKYVHFDLSRFICRWGGKEALRHTILRELRVWISVPLGTQYYREFSMYYVT